MKPLNEIVEVFLKSPIRKLRVFYFSIRESKKFTPNYVPQIVKNTNRFQALNLSEYLGTEEHCIYYLPLWIKVLLAFPDRIRPKTLISQALKKKDFRNPLKVFLFKKFKWEYKISPIKLKDRISIYSTLYDSAVNGLPGTDTLDLLFISRVFSPDLYTKFYPWFKRLDQGKDIVDFLRENFEYLGGASILELASYIKQADLESVRRFQERRKSLSLFELELYKAQVKFKLAKIGFIITTPLGLRLLYKSIETSFFQIHGEDASLSSSLRLLQSLSSFRGFLIFLLIIFFIKGLLNLFNVDKRMFFRRIIYGKAYLELSCISVLILLDAVSGKDMNAIKVELEEKVEEESLRFFISQIFSSTDRTLTLLDILKSLPFNASDLKRLEEASKLSYFKTALVEIRELQESRIPSLIEDMRIQIGSNMQFLMLAYFTAFMGIFMIAELALVG